MEIENLNKQIKVLQKSLEPLIERKSELKEEEEKKERKANLGKCFKFTNSYGGGDNRKRDWIGYMKLTKLEDGGYNTLTIQKDNTNRIKIDESYQYGIEINSFYTEISKEEFMEKFDKLIKEIQDTI